MDNLKEKENISDIKIDIKEKILGEIKSGTVSMRPKFVFTLQLISIVLLSIIVFFLTIFILNFIMFSIRINQYGILPPFGPRGVNPFMIFPWYLFFVDIIFLFILEKLLRKFRVCYKIPVIYLLFGLVVVVATLGFSLDRATPLNDHIFEKREHLPPPVRNFYHGAFHIPR